MTNRLVAFFLLALAAVGAAGTGAYVAFRHNGEATQQLAATTDQAALPAPATARSEGVAETEETLTPSPAMANDEPSSAGTGALVASPKGATAVPVPPPARVSPDRSSRTTSRQSTVPTASPSRSTTSTTTQRQSTVAQQRDAESQAARSPRPAEPVATQPTTPAPADRTPIEPDPTPAAPPAPPAPQFEEVVIPSDAVIGLQVETNVSSETAHIEDRVDARVTRDVRAGGMVAIPAGTRAQGSVTVVDKGGKFKERARLGVRFHTLVLADGTRVPINTETIFREGDSPKGESAAKVGGAAVGGAIIGAILGGGKGAAIGGSVGAAGGTAAVMAGGRNAATLSSGTTVTARLAAPATVTVEK